MRLKLISALAGVAMFATPALATFFIGAQGPGEYTTSTDAFGHVGDTCSAVHAFPYHYLVQVASGYWYSVSTGSASVGQSRLTLNGAANYAFTGNTGNPGNYCVDNVNVPFSFGGTIIEVIGVPAVPPS